MDCFGTNCNTCPNLNVTRVSSATLWTVSVQNCNTCPNLNVTDNSLDSTKTDVMKKTCTLPAFPLGSAKNRRFATTRASFSVFTPLKNFARFWVVLTRWNALVVVVKQWFFVDHNSSELRFSIKNQNEWTKNNVNYSGFMFGLHVWILKKGENATPVSGPFGCFCQSLLPLRRCRCCKKNIRCLVRIRHRIRCWKLHWSRSMLTWLLLISPTLTPWSHGSPMVLGYHQHLGFKMMP